MTDFIRFINWLALTLTATLLLLALGIEVTAFLRSAKQKDVGSSFALDQNFFACYFAFVRQQIFSMPPKGPPSFFFYFATEWLFENSPRAPFTFSGLCNLPETKKFEKNTKKITGNFLINFFPMRVLYKRILDTLKFFCYFWALDMASTWVVPGLSSFQVRIIPLRVFFTKILENIFFFFDFAISASPNWSQLKQWCVHYRNSTTLPFGGSFIFNIFFRISFFTPLVS